MIDRRDFLSGAAALALVACTPKTGSVTLSATGAAGMNPGPGGADRPLTLHIVQLRATGAFDSADFFALQNPAGALGGDLVKAEQMVLTPGAGATKTIALDPSTTAIGVIAGFRDPGGKAFRAKGPVSPTANVSFAIEIGSGGIALRPA
ncbi:type VI secretion system lipoprotein TssJ [Defluviimonas aestuarii]|uniref:type VI secretion system lipoprotein TssJ n=1 Tax=Albidovulum aestuarii TaxID=1130726 RepID=UPI00249ADAC0|nr:type VI secretion system lipoprotein TssJ [Defluviimonas aestuarii]MDI3337736.1 type VI secretion system lipoprotein TssJ [Defluviimonas aestuarii]